MPRKTIVEFRKAPEDTQEDVVSESATSRSTLCKPQLRIIAVLAELAPEDTLNREEIELKAAISPKWVPEYIGFKDCEPYVRRGGKLTKWQKLFQAKLVKIVDVDVEGKWERRYKLTTAGRKFHEKVTAKGSVAEE